jgi:flagellar biosynthesis/type III secretory pathway M-ring protein FliF/YscJ
MHLTISRMCSVGWNTALIVVLFQAAVSADEAKVKQFQKERLAALAQVAEMKHRAFQRGEIPMPEYANAYEQAYEAELALCDNDAEKTKVREKMLERAKADEEVVARLIRAGEATSWELPIVVARRLAIEIELERLKK